MDDRQKDYIAALGWACEAAMAAEDELSIVCNPSSSLLKHFSEQAARASRLAFFSARFPASHS